jgi:hypothetical protein
MSSSLCATFIHFLQHIWILFNSYLKYSIRLLILMSFKNAVSLVSVIKRRNKSEERSWCT